MTSKPEVTIIGMGYVGLTMAATLANLGINVLGVERDGDIVQKLNGGRSHIFEPGIDKILSATIGRNLTVQTSIPSGVSGAVVICVSTPVGANDKPDLTNLRAATESVAENIGAGTLVIVRSTVPVGTCRNVVLPLLKANGSNVLLASCPERTIQGRAVEELRELPQVVGGLDEASTKAAIALWEKVTSQVVPVSSMEAAEMVKLINNSHTDLLYSYGNEVALMAHRLQLDPMELINAANIDYPRPNLARPGFVAGPCLSKDPYLLLSSFGSSDYVPQMVLNARKLNESLPELVAHHFMTSLKKVTGPVDGAKVLVCGFAYKGWPVTDDTRGTPTGPLIDVLNRYRLKLFVHDFLVDPKKMQGRGAIVVNDLAEGFAGAKAVLFVNDHPDYRELEIARLAGYLDSPGVVYDCWRIFDQATIESVQGIRYGSIGLG